MITIINFLSALGIPVAMVLSNIIICITVYISGILGGEYEANR